jgi:hypothetical protein
MPPHGLGIMENGSYRSLSVPRYGGKLDPRKPERLAPRLRYLTWSRLLSETVKGNTWQLGIA